MTTRIELSSWGPPVVRQLRHEDVIELRKLARDRVAITPTDERDSWALKAGPHVGTIATKNVSVLVRPNIPVANLFHMLEAGGDALDARPEAFDYERTFDLFPAFATLFARVAERALARGLPRTYESRADRLIALRGRIDIATLSRSPGLPIPAPCAFDEYTADGPLNRVIKRATSELMRLAGVTVATRQALRTIFATMDEVGDLQPSDTSREWTFSRLDSHLEPVHRLALMVLGRSSLVDREGTASAGTFLVDMPRVFEEFVAARLTRYLRAELEVVTQSSHPLAVDRARPQIRPDLEFRRGRHTVYVADTKFKLLKDELGRSPDYYQLLTYTSVLALPEGVLIYCLADGEPPAGALQVRTVGTILRTHAISLEGTPTDVDAELHALAQRIVTCVEELRAA